MLKPSQRRFIKYIKFPFRLNKRKYDVINGTGSKKDRTRIIKRELMLYCFEVEKNKNNKQDKYKESKNKTKQ